MPDGQEQPPDFPLNIDSGVLAPLEPACSPSVPPTSPSEARTLPPTIHSATAQDLPFLAGYEVLERIGRGGMGIVYRARQINLNRVVAIKLIDPRNFAGPDHLSRFQAEARAVAQLTHPNIVQIYEVGGYQAPDGLVYPYMALEYVSGGTLAQRLGGQPQRPKDAARILHQIALAVEHAHQQGIIHRDLNPANILIDDKRRERDSPASDIHPALNRMLYFVTPKITDFGVAKNLATNQLQTKSGIIIGTPSYMAPEQAEGKSKLIGPATDVYALGAILYEMLTGRPPFQGVMPMDVLLQVIGEDPIAPRSLQRSIPVELECICLKCLQKDPNRRYASAAELADDLQRFLNGDPVQARPVGPTRKLLKWISKHRQAAIVIFLWHLAILALIGFLSYEWHKAEQTANELRRELTRWQSGRNP